jgi:flavin reductase (DIM6/NTAB) family NADH-FMN oxidoreductase RutF
LHFALFILHWSDGIPLCEPLAALTSWIGDGPIAANLVIGEVVLIHVDDSVLDQRGAVDPRKLRTIARPGGSYYCRSVDLFEMERP